MRAGSVLLLVAGLLIGASSSGEPGRAERVVIGPPAGDAPMGRIDAFRRGRAHHRLPDRPKVLLRTSLRSGIDMAPIAIDERGAAIVATLNRTLSQIDSRGKLEWRVSTGEGPSSAGAVLLNDGTRVVATSAGELLGFSPLGVPRFRAALDLDERTAKAGLLPLEEGGVAVSSGQEVLRYDSDGRVRDRTRLPERITGPLLATAFGLVATTTRGTALVISAGFVKRLGTFGADIGEAGASTNDGRTLVAAVEGQRIVALDLSTGASETRYSAPDAWLRGPVLLGIKDTLAVVTLSGLLLRIDGGVEARVLLESKAGQQPTTPSKVDFAALDDAPAPVTDDDGRVAFARAGGRIGVVSPNGSVNLVSEPTCNAPAALAPSGPGKMLVACRDGSLLTLGDAEP